MNFFSIFHNIPKRYSGVLENKIDLPELSRVGVLWLLSLVTLKWLAKRAKDLLFPPQLIFAPLVCPWWMSVWCEYGHDSNVKWKARFSECCEKLSWIVRTENLTRGAGAEFSAMQNILQMWNFIFHTLSVVELWHFCYGTFEISGEHLHHLLNLIVFQEPNRPLMPLLWGLSSKDGGIILHFVFVLQVHRMHHYEWPGLKYWGKPSNRVVLSKMNANCSQASDGHQIICFDWWIWRCGTWS
jgi:hypothetical protein